MAVIETGTDKVSLKIDPFFPGPQSCFLIAAHFPEHTILYAKGLPQRQLSRIDDAVIIYTFHGIPHFLF
jgi:hypothetical protein